MINWFLSPKKPLSIFSTLYLIEMPRARNPPEDFSESKFEKATIGTGLYKEPLIVLYWSPRPNEERWAATTQRAYDEAVKPAQKARDEAMVAVGKAYNEVADAAWKAYNEAVDTARKPYNKAMAAARRARNEAVAAAGVAAAGKAYEAVDTAWKAYNEALDTALKPYNKAMAAAEKARDEAVNAAGKAREAVNAARKAYDEAVQDAQWEKMQHAFEPPSIRYIVYRNDKDTWEETDDADEARNLVRAAFSDLKEERTLLRGAVQRTKEWAAKGVKVARFDPGRVFVRRHVRKLRRVF